MQLIKSSGDNNLKKKKKKTIQKIIINRKEYTYKIGHPK